MGDKANPIYHTQPVFEATTRLVVGGHEWTVTIREGVDQDTIEQGFASMVQAVALAGPQQPVRVPGMTAEPVPASERPQGERGNVERPQPANDGTVQVERVNRLVIGGTLERPIVEMWSSNQALKWAYVKTPANIVQTMLLNQYGAEAFPNDGLAALTRCGSTIPVEWDIQWKPSSKDPRWKDLVGVTIIKRSV